MSEDELKQKEKELYSKEVLLNIREHDLDIYRTRIERFYNMAFPEVEMKFRDIK